LGEGKEMGSSVVEKITARAVRASKRIILPESSDPRVLRAAQEITSLGYARVSLLGPRGRIESDAVKLGVCLAGIEIICPDEDPAREQYIDKLYELRKAKGMTRDQAAKLLEVPVYYGGQVVAAGRADGMVAGSICPTADTIRSSLWSVGTSPGCRTVSSCSIMQTIIPEIGVDGAIIFADTGVIPEPTAEQLADIAIHAGECCRALLDVEPRVAMLSFSTKGSAHSPMVQMVIDATKLAQSKRPDMKIDGELQADAAIIPSIAKTKAGVSEVAGQANVLVFPNLSVGNITYKLVERLGRALALGPLLLGVAKPINDLSRGCSVEDIVLITAITAVQADAAQRKM
jgi:phosphate acetyltransferase